jgi:DNA-binding Lrp family transcriptional regulator
MMNMREIEWKLLSELMKNSRRSDRELAKAIGSSQPTVSRNRKKLEEKGYIRQYTTIPNFSKIGYNLLALTFVKMKRVANSEELQKASEITQQALGESHYEVFMVERGIGLGHHGVIASFHEDYNAYIDFRDFLTQFSFLEIMRIDSFIVNLNDKIRYRPLNFQTLAKHLLTLRDSKKKE